MTRIGALVSNPYFRQVVSSTVTYSVAAVALGAIGLQTLPLAPAALLGVSAGSAVCLTKFLTLQGSSVSQKLLKVELIPTLMATALTGAVALGAPLVFSATLLVVLTEPCVRGLYDLAKDILHIKKLEIKGFSIPETLGCGVIMGGLFAISSLSLRVLGFPAPPFLPALGLGAATGIGSNILGSVQSSTDKDVVGATGLIIIPVLANRLIGVPFTGPATALTFIGSTLIFLVTDSVFTISKLVRGKFSNTQPRSQINPS